MQSQECERTVRHELRPSSTHYYVSTITAVLAIAIGAAQLGGGQPRFTAASYAAARQLMPFWGWGAVLFVAGALTLAGIVLARRRVRRAGLALIAAWASFFAASIAYTATLDPNAVWGAAFVYMWVAAVAATLGRTDVGQLKSTDVD